MSHLVGKKHSFGTRRAENTSGVSFELSREQGFLDGSYDIFDLLVQRNTLLEEADELLSQTRTLLTETEKALFKLGYHTVCSPSPTVNPKP